VTVGPLDDKGPSAATLEFAKCMSVVPTPFGPQEQEHACSTKTYQVKRGEGGFATEPPTEDKDEANMLKLVAGSTLGAPFADALAGKTVKKGETITLTPEAAHRALGVFASDLQVKSMKITLDGERKEGGVDAAVFKVEATMVQPASDEQPGEMKVELTGEMVVAKAALIPVAAALSGPIKMTGSMDQGGQKIEMDGDGKMSWKYAAAIQ
jgi:hypothetical protein